MNLVWSGLVIAAASGVAIVAMLLVRRHAPDGSYFNDGDRAAGVFGVLATGFSVLLGFIVFLAFTSYDQSRTGAEAEALTVAQQVETAQFFPLAVVDELLLLLRFLDNPFHTGVGGLRPVAMERTLLILDQELRVANENAPLPCDEAGNPV